jgi:hypothetical protein
MKNFRWNQKLWEKLKEQQNVCIVTCMSDYRRGLNWWLYLLTTYTLTTRDYNLQITDTHELVSLAYQSLH